MDGGERTADVHVIRRRLRGAGRVEGGVEPGALDEGRQVYVRPPHLHRTLHLRRPRPPRSHKHATKCNNDAFECTRIYELFDLMNSYIRVPTRAAVLILSSRLVNTSRTSTRTLFPSRKLVNTTTLERTITAIVE